MNRTGLYKHIYLSVYLYICFINFFFLNNSEKHKRDFSFVLDNHPSDSRKISKCCFSTRGFFVCFNFKMFFVCFLFCLVQTKIINTKTVFIIFGSNRHWVWRVRWGKSRFLDSTHKVRNSVNTPVSRRGKGVSSLVLCSVLVWHWRIVSFVELFPLIVQELCESRGTRPGLSVLTSLLVSVDVKL